MKQGTPDALRYLRSALDQLAKGGLLRGRSTPLSPGGLSFCSNDYLGLAAHPGIAAAPRGAGSARLVAGERAEHVALERTAAELVGLPAALAFTSGYAANLGTLAALAGPGDLIVSDARNHASIIDGCRLSRAEISIVPHLDVGAVERALAPTRSGRRFVVTESYFSMDADSPDLWALRALCDREDAALIVDEAHALGVLGPAGRGLCREHEIQPDVMLGTFGKAFGAGGAFVAGGEPLIHWLWNRARSFVFSTGLSPAVAAAATEGIRIARDQPEQRRQVLRSSARFRAGLLAAGLEALGFGHIVPVLLGAPEEAVRVANELCARGVLVKAIRPPTVPPGAARLRFTLTAAHTDEAVDRALEVITAVLKPAS